jgi:hypothetical protein
LLWNTEVFNQEEIAARRERNKNERNRLGLKALPEVERELRENAQKRVAERRASFESDMAEIVADAEFRIAKIGSHRQAICSLEGVEGVKVNAYWNGEHPTAAPGFFKSTKKGNRELGAKLRAVCEALGCGFEKGDDGKVKEDKDLAEDGKHVECTRRPKDYPDLRVTFQRNIPAGAKCKIVAEKSVRKRLVCEL